MVDSLVALDQQQVALDQLVFALDVLDHRNAQRHEKKLEIRTASKDPVFLCKTIIQ